MESHPVFQYNTRQRVSTCSGQTEKGWSMLYGDYGILPLVIALLQREGRVTYWALQQQFGFDTAFVTGLRDELLFKGLAMDEGGKGLVWTGGPSAGAPIVSSTPDTAGFPMAAPASSTFLPSPITAPASLSNGPAATATATPLPT